MIRGFVTGLVWGGVVAGAGLAVISQVVPLPQVPTPPEVAAIAPEPLAATAGDPVEPPPPASDDATAPATLQPAPTPPEVEASDRTPAIEQPSEPLLRSTDGTPPDGLSQPQAPESADTPLSGGDDLPAAPPLVPSSAPMAEAGPSTVEPPPPSVIAPDEPLLQPTPTKPVADALLPQVPSETQPRMLQPDAPADAPRLIVPDGKPLTETARAAPGTDIVPLDDSAADPAVALTPLATPLELFARPFDNPDSKPLFAILLLDDGAAATDRETLAALPFAVTFVIDPLAPGAAGAAAIYRKAGQEVMMQTGAVPKGATASDIEQSYQALDLALPEAVATLGVAGLEQDSQQLATAAVPIISAQGRGVVTLDRGLSAVDQVAQREGVPHATVFRLLDGAGETVPVIRRYLDRAAFRAAQEGSVVVLGSTKPDTIAAILQWTVEGRGATVALAPISAVLRLAK